MMVLLTYGDPAWAHRPHDVVTQVEISPDFREDKTVFIVVRNNLYKSVDAGKSWERLVQGLNIRTSLSSLAVSPQTKDVLYVTTRGDGLYTSQDAGVSWARKVNGLTTLDLGKIEISPTQAMVALVGGQEKGLYRTTDGGETWSPIWQDNRSVSAIAFSVDQPNFVFIGSTDGTVYSSADQGITWSPTIQIKEAGAITAMSVSSTFSVDDTLWLGTETGGLYESRDRGMTFTSIGSDIPDKHITDIIAAERRADVPYLLVSTWDAGFFHSEDGGKRWVSAVNGLIKDRQADELEVPHFYDLAAFSESSNEPDLFLAGFNGLYYSGDGGREWQTLESLSPSIVTDFSISPNYVNDGTLAIGTYVRGIYLSNDGGETWSRPSQGLHLPLFTRNFAEPYQDPRRYFDISFSPNYREDKTIFATILWSKVLRSTNGGKSWKIIDLGQGIRGMTVLISPNFAQDKTVYVTGQEGKFFRSINGGKTFKEISGIGSHRGNHAPSFVASPTFAKDGILFSSGSEGIYESTDRGETWRSLTQGIELAARDHLQIAVSPAYDTDQTIFVGTDQGIFKSQDGGEQWVRLTGTVYGDDDYIEAIALSPDFRRDQTLMVSVRGQGLFRSTDAGITFAPLGDRRILLSKINNIPSAGMAIQFSPAYSSDNTLYGMGDTQTALYKSIDQGMTWEKLVVPPMVEETPTLMAQIQINFYIYKGRFLRLGIALGIAILSYGALILITHQRKLPINRWIIRFVGTLVVFVGALIVLLK